ncbi:MAG TPA: hypothetical protein VFW07_12690 [Parafilimonas sp.]|nr:hypothetical protein [Parafilimonas sp.]
MKTKFFSFRLILFAISFVLSLTIDYCPAQGFSPETKTRLRKIIDSFQNNPENKYVGGLPIRHKLLAGR